MVFVADSLRFLFTLLASPMVAGVAVFMLLAQTGLDKLHRTGPRKKGVLRQTVDSWWAEGVEALERFLVRYATLEPVSTETRGLQMDFTCKTEVTFHRCFAVKQLSHALGWGRRMRVGEEGGVNFSWEREIDRKKRRGKRSAGIRKEPIAGVKGMVATICRH